MAIGKSVTTLLLIMMMSLGVVVNSALGANYIVGGPNGGWDATTDVQTWAASLSFQPGDNLIFQYAPNHDVVEVPKSDYDSCQVTTPIQSYSGGAAAVPLPAAGKRYFICGTPGHCTMGMKLEVNVLGAGSPASAAAPQQSPAASPATSLPFPSVESPAEYSPVRSPPALEIPVLGSSPALSPFPTGTSALTPPAVESSDGGNGFLRIHGVAIGLMAVIMVIV